MSAEMSREVAIAAVRRQAEDLAREAAALPAERHSWIAGGVARTPIQIVAHCGTMCRFFAAVVTGEPLPYRGQDEHDAAIAACTTMEDALDLLNRSSALLIDAYAALPASRFDETMVMPWGERVPVPLGLLAPAFHMRYHEGQICFIQTILGDDEFH